MSPPAAPSLDVAIVGGGWAGMAAAVRATQAGHRVTVLEVARTLGGRARAMRDTLPDGTPVLLDNGQHILIGAYTESLALMREVGVDPAAALLRLPLSLLYADGTGLRLPDGPPAPLDALLGILQAEGWDWRDRLSLLRVAARWQFGGFRCTAPTTVLALCEGLSPRVMDELIEPLCVSALNLPAARASGQVFLRVIRDSLFSGRGGSNLLLPRTDLSSLFPDPAAAWLTQRGARVRVGVRVQTITRSPSADRASANALPRWRLGCGPADAAPGDTAFDAVILACPVWEAARLVAGSGAGGNGWLHRAAALDHEAITTVYATSRTRLAEPMLSLRSSRMEPAQFVFDRGQLGGPRGLLAFVVSASQGERSEIEARVVAQGQRLGLKDLQVLQTVVERRATFACTPGLQRPPTEIVPGLLACGDYVEGPYPATLEGAVRSAAAAVARLSAVRPPA
jgi:squalene-associated FAD-dependent desaturase